MSASYNGDHVNFSNSTFHGSTTGKQEIHHHYPVHKVDWPVRVGVIPEEAAHFQHRAIANHLDQALNSFGAVVLRQVLSGTSGVGKTQLAAHYAHTLRDVTDSDQQVDVLVWAHASSRERITSAYAQAAWQLYSTIPDDPEDAAALFLTWLSNSGKNQNRRWLIVWDDLTNPAEVTDLWPPHDQAFGRVLVTTRRRDHSLTLQGRHLLDVDVYTPTEAHAFLSTALSAASIPHTAAQLDALAYDLGHLPLALGQAITYMAELGMGCDDYLQVFHDRMSTLEEVFPSWERPTSLAATWELSLTQANAFSPRGVARPLMGLIALLDGTGIPEEVLTAPCVLEYLTTRSSDATTVTRTPHQVRAALAALHRLSLITRTLPPPISTREVPSQALVGAHQLVQRATREHAITRPDRHSVHTLADALTEVWPEIERDTVLAQRLRGNTTALCSHHAVDGRTSEDWLWEPTGHRLLFRAGRSLGESGRVGDAVAYWQHIAKTAQSYLGPDHPHTLSTRHNLALWRGHTGAPAEASHTLQALLEDRLRVLGPNHPDTLTTRANLANWKGKAGDPNTAVTALRDLLPDLLRVLGPNHPSTLAVRNSLASWQGNTGNPTGAVRAYEDLLPDLLRVLGPNHPDTLTTRANLANWKGKAGDPNTAVTAFQDLLPDLLRVLGPNHPSTLTTRANLAHGVGKAGDPASSLTAPTDFLLDIGYYRTSPTRRPLDWKHDAADAAEAAQDYEDLLTSCLRVLGPHHPETLAVRARLASLQGYAGNSVAAVTAFQDLLPDLLRVLSPDHSRTLAARHNLAWWTYKSGNTTGAVKLLTTLVSDWARVFSPDHPNTRTSKRILQRWQDELPEG